MKRGNQVLILESTVSFAQLRLAGAGKRLFFRGLASLIKNPQKCYVQLAAIGNSFGHFAFLLFQTG